MSGCRNRQDLTFQYPCSVGSPRFARGTAWGAWVLPLRRGNLREGVVNYHASRGEPRGGSVPPASRGYLQEGVVNYHYANSGSAISRRPAQRVGEGFNNLTIAPNPDRNPHPHAELLER